MKCPKCGYIGFETSDRCRNCGYDFSLLLDEGAPLEWSFREDEPLGPLADLSLDEAQAPQGRGKKPPAGSDLDRAIGSPDRDAELPLFSRGVPADDLPLITPAPVPRPPLAVRRATPQMPKVRGQVTPPELLEPELALEPPTVPVPYVPISEAAEAARAGRRVLAALVDLVILGGLDAAVVYFTLRLCRLAPAEILLLPVGPLVAFFLLLDGGYLVAFTTAGGQTIGKMAAGIRIVGASDGPVSFGQAVVRTVAYLGSALPVGLGFVPAVVGHARRALHDRLAGTRVITVSAE